MRVFRCGCYVAVLAATVACDDSSIDLPKVECPPSPDAAAVLCTRAVAMELGPADQFVGYRPTDAVPLALIPGRARDSFSTTKSPGGTFLLRSALAEIANLPGAASLESDSHGRARFSGSAGSYTLCAGWPSQPPSAPLSWCLHIDLAEQAPVKLVLVDNPRAGIEFLIQS